MSLELWEKSIESITPLEAFCMNGLIQYFPELEARKSTKIFDNWEEI